MINYTLSKGDNGKVGAEGTSYANCDEEKMMQACRNMAGWKLASNGGKVSLISFCSHIYLNQQ